MFIDLSITSIIKWQKTITNTRDVYWFEYYKYYQMTENYYKYQSCWLIWVLQVLSNYRKLLQISEMFIDLSNTSKMANNGGISSVLLVCVCVLYNDNNKKVNI